LIKKPNETIYGREFLKFKEYIVIENEDNEEEDDIVLDKVYES
jgi:hypothetical protein